MLMEVMAVPPRGGGELVGAAELDDKLTVSAVVVTLPKASCS